MTGSMRVKIVSLGVAISVAAYCIYCAIEKKTNPQPVSSQVAQQPPSLVHDYRGRKYYILDEAKAKLVLKKAEAGDPEAMFELADWHLRKGNQELSEYWGKMNNRRVDELRRNKEP